MTDRATPIDPVREAYDSMASIYDDFNHLNDHEMWIGKAVLPELDRLGLPAPGAALDVACGTGMAFPPLLERGWSVHGCDISPAMVAAAEERFGDRARLDVADMRGLSTFGSFELILVMNDAINHLLGAGDLEAALAGMAKNLAPDGLLAFDCNTEAVFQSAHGPSVRRTIEHGGRSWVWQGLGASADAPSLYSFQITGDAVDPITITERYYPPEEVEAAIESSGLRLLRAFGHSEDGERIVLSEGVDEERDYKVLYVASSA